MAGQADSLKSILFALFANTSIAIAKGVAAFVTGSGAMLAEAIHSVADAGNQLLLILGLRQTRKAPTDDHPLGFGKSIYFWSFLVAVILFSLGGMFSLYEGVHKLLHPVPLSHPWIAIGVLVFAIVAEGVSLWGCMREVNKERYGRSIVQWFRNSRSSALIVVFGEDIAAFVGNGQLDFRKPVLERLTDSAGEVVDPFTVEGRNRDGIRVQTGEPGAGSSIDRVDLVEHQQFRQVGGIEFL